MAEKNNSTELRDFEIEFFGEYIIDKEHLNQITI